MLVMDGELSQLPNHTMELNLELLQLLDTHHKLTNLLLLSTWLRPLLSLL